MLATIKTEVSELAAKLEIVSVQRSPTPGRWHYAVKIIDMPVAVRAQLRERYIRQSFPKAKTRRFRRREKYCEQCFNSSKLHMFTSFYTRA